MTSKEKFSAAVDGFVAEHSRMRAAVGCLVIAVALLIVNSLALWAFVLLRTT